MSKVLFSCVFTMVPIKHTGHFWKLVFKMIGGSFERANDDFSFTSSSSASIFKQTETFVYIGIWTMVNKNFYFSLFYKNPSTQGPGIRVTWQPNPIPNHPPPILTLCIICIRKMTMGIDLVSLTPPSLVLELGIVLWNGPKDLCHTTTQPSSKPPTPMYWNYVLY